MTGQGGDTRRRGEFDLIADLFQPLAIGHPGALNLKDDAAILSLPKGYRMVVTTDAVVAGVHFLPDDPPELVAKKAVRVNLSDVAAMGAEPLGILVAACFPKDGGEAWIEAFARGLSEDVHAYNCPVLGGDTVATPGPATITVTALGCAPAGGELRRDGAREGDVLMVTGTLGDAALGLRVCRDDPALAGLSEAHRAFLVDRYRLPRPRVSFGPVLSGMARSCLDVSDGLLGDLKHICECSHLGAEVDLDALPLSEAARAAIEAEATLMEAALCGGDDYELLFTLPEERVEQVSAAAVRCGLTATPIGRMVAGSDVRVRRGDAPATPFTTGRSWSHY